MPDHKLSCLICSHRAPDTVRLLFESLLQQAWEPGDEIVFIDNGIGEDRLPIVKAGLTSLQERGIRVLFAKEPTAGHAHARLKSFEISANPWLILLDDDNSLKSDAIKFLRDTISEHDDLGGICPQIQPVWAYAPENWMVILGHHILSYNNSSLIQGPLIFGIWHGGALGERPPGGGMIIHRSAVDSFLELCKKAPIIRSFGRSGSQLFSCEDFILYNQLYILQKPTAYIHKIIIDHHIPEHRMKFSYLLRLAFWAHYSFGFLGIMRRGRRRVIYSLYRHIGMLILSMLMHGRHTLSFKVLAGYFVMMVGAVTGSIGGFANKNAIRICIDPDESDSSKS